MDASPYTPYSDGGVLQIKYWFARCRIFAPLPLLESAAEMTKTATHGHARDVKRTTDGRAAIPSLIQILRNFVFPISFHHVIRDTNNQSRGKQNPNTL